MKHARQQIFDHVKLQINEICDVVEIQMPWDIERKHSTHISISFDNDAVNLERSTMETEAHDMVMVLSLTVKSSGVQSAGPLADDLAVRVQRALSSPMDDVDGNQVADGVHTISGATVDIDVDATDSDESNSLEYMLARLYMRYSVFYRNTPGMPDVLV